MTYRRFRADDDEHETFEGRVIKTTTAAVLIATPDGDEIWFPRSVIDGGAGLDEGDEDPAVARWFLEKEGLV